MRNSHVSSCFGADGQEANCGQTWMGFWSVRRWMISKAWATMRTAMSFFPLLRPFIIKLSGPHALSMSS